MNILIDDIRMMNVDIIARNYDSGLSILNKFNHLIDTLYIDHDLGSEDPNETGYTLISDLIQSDFKKHPDTIIIVSSNPVGRDNIARALLNNGYKKETPSRFIKIK